MNKYGISEAKSTVGFKTHAVPNRALGEAKSLRGWLLRGAVFVSAFSLMFSTFAPSQTALATNQNDKDENDRDKITICHAPEGQSGDKYVIQKVSINSIIKDEGHDSHNDDIIPPFSYNGDQQYPGKNWDEEGQAIHKDDCGAEKYVVCYPHEQGLKSKTFRKLEKAKEFILKTEGADLSENGRCGEVQDCDTIPGNDVPDCEPICDDNLQTTIPDCPTYPIDVLINKVWEGYDNNEGPSNKTDIKIEVTSSQEDDVVVCVYDENGNLVEEGTDNDCVVEFPAGQTIDIEETGIPVGWSATGTGEVTPNCNLDLDNNEKVSRTIDCTVTIVNVRDNPEPCSTELIVNGSFEFPEVEDKAKWDVFPSGSEGMGWSVEWVRTGGSEPSPANMELHEGVLGDAFEGNQYTELDSDWGGPGHGGSEDASVEIYQDISTKIGSTYTLKFATSPRPDQSASQNEIRLDVGNVVVGSVFNSTSASDITWTENEVTFVANSTTTRIQFTDIGPGNSFGGFLDDVSLIEDCLSDVIICKEDYGENRLPGWEVFLKGSKPVASVEVMPDGNTYSSPELPAGEYVLEASGTYVYRPNSSGNISDAGYTLREPEEFGGPNFPYWLDVNNLPNPWQGFLGVQVNGTNPNWGPLDEVNHEYSAAYSLASDADIDFRILDSYYGDNSGSLDVDIYAVYGGVTENDGCVTLEDVPYGTYDLGEIMQEGWENISGNGLKVVIDGIEDEFTLVNECTGENCVVPCSEKNLGWASDYVISGTTPGTLKGGGPITNPNRIDPTEATGEADWVSGTGTNFYSLGFDGVITLSFTGYVNDVIGGDDLNIFEATNGTYPEESVLIEVSQDGSNFLPLTEEASNTSPSGVTAVDFSETGFAWIKFVRLTDTSNPADFPQADADGFDLDAVEAMVETCEPPQEPEPCVESPINVMSSTSTQFVGIKQGGSAPTDFIDESQYDTSAAGNAVVVGPTGYPGAWTAENDVNLSGTQWVSNDATQPTGAGSGIYDGTEDSWRLFKHEFTIPAGAKNISSPTLYYAADNAVNVYFDGVEIATTGFMAAAADNPQFFKNALSINLPVLTTGVHTLEFAVRNSAFQIENNPTGLMYRLDTITYDCDDGGNGDNGFGISGKVYNDKDEDNDFDGDDSGLAGWIVKLFKMNSEEGIEGFVEGEPEGYSEIAQTVSGENGDYSFDNLSAGCYIVDEVEQPENGWSQTEPTTENHWYFVSLGGAECPFGVIESPEPEYQSLFSIAVLAINLLDGCIDQSPVNGVVHSPCGAVSLDFGNYQEPSTNGGGSRSSGSSTNDDGRVLGDSTGLPYQAPQVLGVATELPRTGTPISIAFSLLGLLAIIAIPKLAEVKR